MYAKMLEDQERARADRLAATYAQAEKKVANLELNIASKQLTIGPFKDSATLDSRLEFCFAFC